jgi:Flp pilus assembly pilin Flp
MRDVCRNHHTDIIRVLRRFVINEHGVAASEYASLLGVIAITCFTAFSLFGDQISLKSNAIAAGLTDTMSTPFQTASGGTHDATGPRDQPTSQPNTHPGPRKRTDWTQWKPSEHGWSLFGLARADDAASPLAPPR